MAWPSVVVADAESGRPLFRVRSATLQLFFGDAAGDWIGADWLATGDALLLRAAPGKKSPGGTALLRIRPTPRIEQLSALEGAIPAGAFQLGTIASPTGSDRFFVETYRRLQDVREEIVALYDAHEDRWHTAVLISTSLYGDYDYLRPSWGASDRELRLTFAGGAHTSGAPYLGSQSRIEFPPFSDEFPFRVVGTGSCLYLREAPGEEGAVVDCLPDGTRVVLRHSQEWTKQDGWRHPSLAWWQASDHCCSFGTYVRTEDGLEGWVASDYLDHD